MPGNPNTNGFWNKAVGVTGKSLFLAAVISKAANTNFILFIYIGNKLIMGEKGVLTKADYLSSESLLHLFKCLHNDHLYKWEAFCRISFYMGLRVSDVLSLCWSDILDKGEFIKREKKTRKYRPIKIKKDVRIVLKELYQLLGSPDEDTYIFVNDRTGKPYTSKHINHLLKIFRVKYNIRIRAFSTHTFRKSFGRCAYEALNRSAEALVLLNAIYLHADFRTTRAYIGLQQDEIDKIYDSLPI